MAFATQVRINYVHICHNLTHVVGSFFTRKNLGVHCPLQSFKSSSYYIVMSATELKVSLREQQNQQNLW